MRILGLSYPQLRARLDTIERTDNLLTGQVRKGLKGRFEYSSAVLAMLQDVEEFVRTQDMQVAQAVEEVAGKVQGDSTTRDYQPDSSGINLLVEELQSRVAWLEAENTWLRGRLDALTPQLSAGRRHRWNPFRRDREV